MPARSVRHSRDVTTQSTATALAAASDSRTRFSPCRAGSWVTSRVSQKHIGRLFSIMTDQCTSVTAVIPHNYGRCVNWCPFVSSVPAVVQTRHHWCYNSAEVASVTDWKLPVTASIYNSQLNWVASVTENMRSRHQYTTRLKLRLKRSRHQSIHYWLTDSPVEVSQLRQSLKSTDWLTSGRDWPL